MLNRNRPITEFTNMWKYYRDPVEELEMHSRMRAAFDLGAIILADVGRNALEHAREIVRFVSGDEAPRDEK